MRVQPDRRLPVGLFCCLLVLHTALSTVPGTQGTPLVGAVYFLIYLGFIGSVLARAITPSKHQRAWIVLAVGFAFNASAAIYDALVVVPGSDLVFPTAADGGYLLTYLFALAAIALVIRTEVGELPAMTWLDGAISLFGAAAVITSFVLGVLIETKDGNALAVLAALAYPVSDALLIGMLVGFVALSSKRPSPMWGFLLVGLLLYAVGDILYLAELSRGTYTEGGWLNTIWTAALISMGLAAWASDEASEADNPPRSNLTAIALPITFAALALSVITTGTFTEVPASAVTLACITIGLVVVRTAMSFQQAQQLGLARGEARTDDLTGLANRRFFYEELAARLKRRCNDDAVSIVLFDLARFKEVNDAFGHETGDRILEAVGSRASGTLRSTDFLARLGSDEFVVIVDGDLDMADQFARRLREQLMQPFDIGPLTTTIDADVGLSSCPEHSTDADRLIQQADLAMRLAKDQRSGVRAYSPDEDIDVRERAEIVSELRRDISTNAMVLHYQPKLDLQSGRITGVEALVRWQHPTRGLLYPDTFLDLTEKSGLMQQLTQNVLASSLKQACSWKAAGLDLKVSINLSPSDLRSPGFAECVAEQLATNGLEGSALQVELTEEVLMSDPDLGRGVLTHLRNIGVSVSIDDFGTGYSSLAYLQQLPVDELKLDRSFVMQLDSSEKSAPIVRSTIDLAHSLGLSFVAEGVESESTLEQLTAWGCDVAQGYFVGRPGPVEEITGLLVDRQPQLDA